MARNRIIVRRILLAAVLLIMSIVISVGVTQARYENTATAPAVVSLPETGVISNCLVTEADIPRTVLLGQLEWEESVMVPFQLKSLDADVSQKLNWGVVNGDYADYLDICVFAGFDQLTANKELELLEGVELDLFLRIEPTEEASTTPHGPLKINVFVTYGTQMWGTFQVVLPPVAEPETEPVTEPPTEPATEAETEPETEVATEPATEPVTEGETEPVAEAATELAPEAENEPVAEATIEPATEGETEPATEATTEPTTEATTEPATETMTEPATEPVTEPATEPVTDIQIDYDYAVVQLDLIQLKSIPSFHAATDKLPLMITLDKNVTSVRLGIQRTYGDSSIFEPFPNYTMLSLDGGASYYMLYGNYYPELMLQEVTSLPILLDFSYADLEDVLNVVEVESKLHEELNVAMEVYTGSRMRKLCAASIIPDTSDSGATSIYPLVKSKTNTVQVVDSINTETEGQFPNLILTPDETLEFHFPIAWKDADLDYQVEVLTMTEEKKLEYVPVELTREGMYSTYHVDDNTHKLVLRLGETFAQPGTYRIQIIWSYEEVPFTSARISFFVNCPMGAQNVSDGLEVPNDN